MITQTAKYALKALLCLIQQDDLRYYQTKEIARRIDVPANYLGKTMQKLAQARILDSQKGLHGGFRLARSADKISIYDIFIALEVIPRDFSLDSDPRHDDLPAGIYAKFSELNQIYADHLKKMSLADILEGASPVSLSRLRQSAAAR